MENRVIYPWEVPQQSPKAPPPAPPQENPPPGNSGQPQGMAQPLEDAFSYSPVQELLLPAAPAYAMAHAFQGNQVTVLWNESARAEGYLILRGEHPVQLKPVAAVEESSYIDTQTKPCATYYYAVRAYNEHGQSGATPTVQVTTQQSPARSAAQSAAQSAGNTEDTEPNVRFAGKRLRVSRKHDDGNKVLKTGNGSAAEKAAPRHDSALAPPQALRATPQGTRLIALSWRGAANAQLGVEYRLYRSATPWCCYGLIAETQEEHYLDTAPDAGTKYYYFVQAVRAGQASEASPMTEATTFPELPPPEPPQNLRASFMGDSVELRWHHARGAAAYMILARKEPGEEFKVVGHTLDNSFVHTGLELEAQLDYRVQSYHDTGASEPSEICSAKVGAQRQRGSAMPRPAPQPPANLPLGGPRRFPSFSLQTLQLGGRG